MNLYKVIAKKQQELLRTRKELHALLVTLRLLEDAEATSPPSKQYMTQADAAAAVLKSARKPLHIQEIRKQLRRRFRKDIRAKVLTAVLYQYAKRGKYFYKDDSRRNTYGLVEWLVTPARAEAEPPET